MSIPHRCPVCEGRGEVGKRLAQVGSILVSEKPQRFKCHGCCATGIVWDTTFTLNPLQPWTTGEIPSIGGGSVSFSNLPFETYREKCDSCNGYVLANPEDGCKTPMVHPAIVFEPPVRDPKWTGDQNCACSPDGEPHSDACKGA